MTPNLSYITTTQLVIHDVSTSFSTENFSILKEITKTLTQNLTMMVGKPKLMNSSPLVVNLFLD